MFNFLKKKKVQTKDIPASNLELPSPPKPPAKSPEIDIPKFPDASYPEAPKPPTVEHLESEPVVIEPFEPEIGPEINKPEFEPVAPEPIVKPVMETPEPRPKPKIKVNIPYVDVEGFKVILAGIRESDDSLNSAEATFVHIEALAEKEEATFVKLQKYLDDLRKKLMAIDSRLFEEG